MEFDRNRVYSAVNADELEVGDKVITAQQLSNLKYQVSQRDYYVWTIKEIKEETYSDRFVTANGAFPLVYLVERARNCTNCRFKLNPECNKSKWPEQAVIVFRCDDYVQNTEQKVAHDCKSCRYKNCGFKDFNANNDCDRWEAEPKTKQKAEKKYRPFRDVDELIKVWEEKTGATSYWGKGADLVMPHIWVKRKNFPKDKGTLITSFDEDIVYVGICQRTMSELFDEYTFLDGSPCGMEE